MTARRSPRGGGSLQQLAPGRWRSQGIDPTGRRRSATHHVATKREAVEAHTRFMVRIGAEDTPGPGKRTVNDLLDEWWKHHKPELAPTSAYRYERHIALVREHLGAVPLARVRPLLLDRFYRAEGITPHRAGQLRGNVLHGAFERAVDWGWLPSNPVTRTKLPKTTKRTMRAPTKAEVDAFTQAILDAGPEWLGMFVHILSRTGARKGECLGLRWDDIDWDAGLIRIERSVAITPDKGVFAKAPKTERGTRVVKVEARTLALLHAWQPTDATGYLFASPDPIDEGRPRSPNTIDRAFGTAKRRHPFPYRMHDIRHAVATTALSAGHSPRAIADMLGHSDPKVTLGIYAHSLPKDFTDIAATLDAD